MSLSDPLGDMLTRIRNGQRVGKSTVLTPASRLRRGVLDVLKAEGYIRGFSLIEGGPGKTHFEIELKYYDGGPVIKEISRVSRPGRRVYAGIKSLPRHYGGLGVSILSTPQGVMSDGQARAANVGGEILCRVF